MEQGLVSVIVPIYNTQEYLSKCLGSLAKQTYTAAEFLLVVDGATDGSEAICRAFAKADGRFRVAVYENRGLSTARNTGLEMARGEYVCFVDSDDFVCPQMLEKAVQGIKSSDADICCFNHWVFHDSDGWLAASGYKSGCSCLESNEARLRFIAARYTPAHMGLEVWSKIYRHSLLLQSGVRFADNRQVFGEDFCFFLELLPHVGKIAIIPQRLYYYRHSRHGSIMQQAPREKLDKFIALARHVEGALNAAPPFWRQHFAVFFAKIMDNQNLLFTADELKAMSAGLRGDAFWLDNAQKLPGQAPLLRQYFGRRQAGHMLARIALQLQGYDSGRRLNAAGRRAQRALARVALAKRMREYVYKNLLFRRESRQAMAEIQKKLPMEPEGQKP